MSIWQARALKRGRWRIRENKAGPNVANLCPGELINRERKTS